MFAVHGKVGKLLKSRLKTLCVSETKDCYVEHKVYGWKLRTEPHLWTSRLGHARAFLLAGGGQSLRTLVVGREIFGRKINGNRSRDVKFIKHCVNLKSVSVAEEDAPLLAPFENQLENIEVKTTSPLDIPLNSDLLRELTLTSFSDNVAGAAYLWQRIGPSLETLFVHNYFPAADQSGALKEHCRNLKSISLEAENADDTSAIGPYWFQ